MNQDSSCNIEKESTQFDSNRELSSEQVAGEREFQFVNERESDQSSQFRNEFEPGTIDFNIPGYEIHEIIGRGGSSIVYRATEVGNPDVTVAIKVLRNGIDERHTHFRFDREVNSLRSLRHACIAQLKQAGVNPAGKPFLVLEYIDGERIDHYCQRHNLPIRERVQLFLMVCNAVHFAHQNQILHRDIKPANILVARSGQPFLTDFGLAKLVEPDELKTEATRTGVVLGTLNYLAPEQVFGMKDELSPALDVFGLGAVLHVLLTEKPLFQFENLVVATREYFRQLPVKLSADHEIPPSLEAICIKCLSPEATDRYPSAGELADEIQRYLDGQSVSAKNKSLRRRVSLLTRQYPWLVQSLLVGFVGITLAMIVFYSLWRNSEVALAVAERRGENLKQSMIEFSNHVRDFEGLPESAKYRAETLRLILETYSRLEPDYNNDVNVQFEIAQTNFKLGMLNNHLGDYRSVHWVNAERYFQNVVRLQPDHEAARFGIFHAQHALNNHKSALQTIESLCHDYPENLNYLDALCNSKYQIGRQKLQHFQIEESKVTIAESMELAARLANAPDPDGRFRRKMADAKLQQAQLLVISDELDKAQGMLGEVLAIYRELDPASLATHGESHEYLNRLSFAISVAAFREDHELVVEYKSELDQFFQAAQQRFPSYQSIYYEQSEALEIYSAYCCYFGLADQLIEVAQQQKAVLDLWKSSATRSIDYYQIMVHYSSSPFFGQTDLDCVASLHHLAWPASHRGHGNILFRLGEFEKASACYEGCQANDPQDLLIQSYCRLLAQIKKVGASRAVVAEISRSDQLKILGVKRSFALAILPERQLRELEMVLASQD